MRTLRDIGLDYFSDKLIMIIIQARLKIYPQIIQKFIYVFFAVILKTSAPITRSPRPGEPFGIGCSNG